MSLTTSIAINTITVSFTKAGTEFIATMSPDAFRQAFLSEDFEDAIHAEPIPGQAVVSTLDVASKPIEAFHIFTSQTTVQGRTVGCIKVTHVAKFAEAYAKSTPVEISACLRLVGEKLTIRSSQPYEKAVKGQPEVMVGIKNNNPGFVLEDNPLYAVLEEKLSQGVTILLASQINNKWFVTLN